MFTIFLSYSTADLAWATHLRTMLTAPGIEVFVAEYDLPPGHSLSGDVVQRIEACDVFLLLWSERAARSEWVGKEVFLAKARGRQIVPLRLGEAPALPAELGDMKYLTLDDPDAALRYLQETLGGQARQKNLVTFSLLGFVAWLALGADRN